MVCRPPIFGYCCLSKDCAASMCILCHSITVALLYSRYPLQHTHKSGLPLVVTDSLLFSLMAIICSFCCSSKTLFLIKSSILTLIRSSRAVCKILVPFIS